MTFFNVLNDIVFYKKGDQLNNVDYYGDFSPFLINRWVSMYSPNMCRVINDTMNRYHSLFEDKSQLYKLYINLLPKQPQKYIRYIKKVKKEESDEGEDDQIELLAKSVELSKREINMYIAYEREHRLTNTD